MQKLRGIPNMLYNSIRLLFSSFFRDSIHPVDLIQYTIKLSSNILYHLQSSSFRIFLEVFLYIHCTDCVCKTALCSTYTCSPPNMKDTHTVDLSVLSFQIYNEIFFNNLLNTNIEEMIYLDVSSVFPVNFFKNLREIFLASSVRYFIEAAAALHSM